VVRCVAIRELLVFQLMIRDCLSERFRRFAGSSLKYTNHLVGAD